MKLFEWKAEEVIEGTSCTVVSFDIEYCVERRIAKGEISVVFETMAKVITNTWVANFADEQWVVSRFNNGRADFFDQATLMPAFTPDHEANSGIERFIAKKVSDFLAGHIGMAKLPHEVVHAQCLWCNPT